MRYFLFALALLLSQPLAAQTYPPQIEAIDPCTLISIQDQQSADTLRADLTTKIFASTSLDTNLLPVFVSNFDVTGTTWQGAWNLASVKKWKVTTAGGLISTIFWFTPTNFRNPEQSAAIIIHSGHGETQTQGHYTEQIKWWVASGYEVITIDMPLAGLNAGEPVVESSVGLVKLRNSHDDMQVLHTESFNPLSFFLEPPLAVVNHLTNLGRTNIAMVGFSGGGWTTDLYAALDPRVVASYSIAGSAPVYTRGWSPPHPSYGDWEQRSLGALGVDYLDLYILASIGEGRGHINMHNYNDNCCFGGTIANHYAPSVESVVQGISGRYGVVFDYTATIHQVTPWAWDWVREDLRGNYF